LKLLNGTKALGMLVEFLWISRISFGFSMFIFWNIRYFSSLTFALLFVSCLLECLAFRVANLHSEIQNHGWQSIEQSARV
jgi:hypothetical protein